MAALSSGRNETTDRAWDVDCMDENMAAVVSAILDLVVRKPMMNSNKNYSFIDGQFFPLILNLTRNSTSKFATRLWGERLTAKQTFTAYDQIRKKTLAVHRPFVVFMAHELYRV